MEFFRKNNVKGNFQDKNHMEKVLNRAFPSPDTKESQRKRMVKSQAQISVSKEVADSFGDETADKLRHTAASFG